MKEIDVVPLIVDLGNSFFRSSRDALHRAQSAKSGQGPVAEPTGLNIFSHRQSETQASLETIVFAFLTVEATINYLFSREQSARSWGLHAWLREKWKRSLSVHDRFVLLVSQYATGNLERGIRTGYFGGGWKPGGRKNPRRKCEKNWIACGSRCAEQRTNLPKAAPPSA
jgi:hypothetical protein